MQYGRPPTGSLANRPSTRSGAGATSWGRAPGTAAPPKTGAQIPGTAFRPGTAARAAAAMTGIQILDRPTTQQGLGGLKTGVQGPRRTIQDKTFFTGELRQKINYLTAEMSRLGAEAEQIEKDNNNFVVFEKKADALAEELRELQGQFGDYNMLVEKIHTDTELEEIERQIAAVKSKNARENAVLNEVFAQRSSKEAALKDLEKKIEEETMRFEETIAHLPQSKRDEYFALKAQNTQYMTDIATKQVELESLTNRIKSLMSNLNMNPEKQRVLELYEKISEAKSRKADLEVEIKMLNSKDGGPEEREKLLKKVKEDNQEISGMERRIGELDDDCRRMKEQIMAMDGELESSQGERNAKYEELLKRDKEMQSFLDSFEERKAEALRQNAECEQTIVSLLDAIKNLSKANSSSLPSQDEFQELQGDLKFKEKEMKNSENTADALLLERERRLQDLEKVNQLETKLVAELSALKEKLATLEHETNRVRNIDAAKRKAEEAKKNLLNERESLKTQLATLKTSLQSLESKHAAQKQQLAENETHAHLSAMEQKLRHHESNNFHLRELILQKNAESDYKPLVNNVLRLVDDCNSQIMKLMSLPPAR